jgi:hypothetical protein
VRVWVTGRRDCPEKGAAGERQQQQLRHRHLRRAQPSRHYRENNQRTWKKHIPLGACNLRVVTGHRAGLGLCLAVRARNADRAQLVRKAFTGESIGKMPESAKHCCGTLVRGRGEDTVSSE